QNAALDVHILKAERILGPNQRRQRADLYVKIALNQLKIALRERAVDVFHRVASRKERCSYSWQVVDATLQIELPPAGGLLDEHMRIADVPVRRRVACNVISSAPTHAAQNTCDLQFPWALLRNRRC